MKKRTCLIALTAAVAIALPAVAAEVPRTAAEVAKPGGRLPGNPAIQLVKVADGFNDPVNVTSARDGSGRLFVVERVGRIKIVDRNGRVLPEPFLDLTQMTPLGTDVQTGFLEQGLYSIAFHPQFKQNRYVYVHYASLPFNGDGLVVRFTVAQDNPNKVDLKTAKVLMRIEQPWYNHNGGQIEFGPKDGYLYISSGDGGWEGDPGNFGQDLSSWLGKMLRIDVNVDDDRLPYRIPPSNPLAEASKERIMALFGITEEGFSKIKTRSKPEIWAYGLRNPWEFSFDRRTGDLYMAEVGQNHWEEIDFQPASSKGGENYGWAINMATHCHPMELGDNCPKVGVLPAAEYHHDFGCAVMGFGVAYYGGMNGVYLTGDWCSGRVWGLGYDTGAKRWQYQELLHTGLQFTGGGEDEDGNVYAVACQCFYTTDKGPLGNPPGHLWRIVPASQVPAGAQVAPAKKK